MRDVLHIKRKSMLGKFVWYQICHYIPCFEGALSKIDNTYLIGSVDIYPTKWNKKPFNPVSSEWENLETNIYQSVANMQYFGEFMRDKSSLFSQHRAKKSRNILAAINKFPMKYHNGHWLRCVQHQNSFWDLVT